MHYFSVEKPQISVEITEISPGIHRNFVFEFKSPFRSEIAKSAEISAKIPFPVIRGILRKNRKVNPGKEWRGASGWSEREGGGSERGAAHRTEGACGSERGVRVRRRWEGDVRRGRGATYEGGRTNEKKVTLSLFLVVEIPLD